MKIAITIDGESLDAMLDPRFGRARRFMLYDTADDSYTIIDNTQNFNAAQGAGIQSAQNIAAAGAKVLISGHTGPKAFSILKMAEIAIYYSETRPVKDAIEAYKRGELQEAVNADVESHWI